MIYTDYFLKIQSEFYDKFGNFHRFFASRQSEEIFPRLSEFSIDQFDRGKVVDTRKNQDLPIPSNKKASDGKDLSRRSLQRPGGPDHRQYFRPGLKDNYFCRFCKQDNRLGILFSDFGFFRSQRVLGSQFPAFSQHLTVSTAKTTRSSPFRRFSLKCLRNSFPVLANTMVKT